MNIKKLKFSRIMIWIIFGLFILWSAGYIFRSSLLGFDGKRYYCLVDDAMISMRYAWNFSQGNGLVWNPGERVEGYSNLLMTLVMSLANLFFNKSSAVLSIQIFGVLAVIGIGTFSLKVFKLLENTDSNKQSKFGYLTLLLVISYYPLLIWTLLGMESGLLSFLMLLGIYQILQYTETHQTKWIYFSAITFGLAFLTRNDALIYAISSLILLTVSLFVNKKGRLVWNTVLKFLVIFLIFVIGQFVFRYLYYGQFVPNTYVLKLEGMPLLLRLQNGFNFVLPLVTIVLPLFVIAMLEFFGDFSFRKGYLILLPAISILYQIYVGGDGLSYWRMFAPVMPLLLIMVNLSIVRFFTLFSQSEIYQSFFNKKPLFSAEIMIHIFSFSVVCVSIWHLNKPYVNEALLLRDAGSVPMNYVNVNRAVILNEVLSDQATIGVTWAGSIPYYTGRKAIDFLGKSDPVIANLPPDISGAMRWAGMSSAPGHNKYDLEYSIIELEPTYVQSFVWGLDDLSDWQEENYYELKYMGISIFLLNDSPDVKWDVVENYSR